MKSRDEKIVCLPGSSKSPVEVREQDSVAEPINLIKQPRRKSGEKERY